MSHKKTLTCFFTFVSLFLFLFCYPVSVRAEDRQSLLWTGEAIDFEKLSELCRKYNITSKDVLFANDIPEDAHPAKGTALIIPSSRRDVIAVWQIVQSKNRKQDNLVNVKLHGVPSFMTASETSDKTVKLSASEPPKEEVTLLSSSTSPKEAIAKSLKTEPVKEKKLTPKASNPPKTDSYVQQAAYNEVKSSAATVKNESGSGMRLVISGGNVEVVRSSPSKAIVELNEKKGVSDSGNIMSGFILKPTPSNKELRLSSKKMIWPVNGKVSSPFGWRSKNRFHSGIDIPMPRGTAIKAAADGVVSNVVPHGCRSFSGYGNVILIDHGKGLVTMYSHCLSMSVKAGQKVKQGDVIGTVGRTGRATTNHVHFEVRVNGKAVNPITYLPPSFN